MAEDRGMEPCERLLKLSKETDIYRHFIEDACRKAGGKYHSGLFRFRRGSRFRKRTGPVDARIGR